MVLPQPVAPTRRDRLAGRHGEVEAVEHHRQLGRVGERHALEAHVTRPAGGAVGGQRPAARVVADHRGGDEDLVHPLGGGRGRWPWAMIMPSIRSGQISITT